MNFDVSIQKHEPHTEKFDEIQTGKQVAIWNAFHLKTYSTEQPSGYNAKQKRPRSVVFRTGNWFKSRHVDRKFQPVLGK